MEAYLDNSATTILDPQVLSELNRIYTQVPGNPSSLYSKGLAAEQELDSARRILAASLGVESREIYFTSGGTEANNIGLIGAARSYRRRGKHIITTSVEHPSVLGAMESLKEEGFEVTLLPCDREGRIQPQHLLEALREDTILVSTMFVNNESGAIAPIGELASVLAKRDNNLPLWHVDAVQGYGRIELDPKKLGIDLVSLSAHKIHGPKGCGALYLRRGVVLSPVIHGGGQERGLRPGTENVAAIAALGKAAQLALATQKESWERMGRFREQLIDCSQKCGGIVNGPKGRDAAAYILNLSFPGVPAEVLVHSADARGIYLSTGSACSSKQKTPSHVLEAMGLERELYTSAVRVSLSRLTKKEEIEYTCQVLPEVVGELRALYGQKKRSR